MQALKLAIGVAWLVFWVYWLASAATSKASARGGWRTRLTGVSGSAVIVIADAFRGDGLATRSVILAVIGAVLFVCGIALAVWARLHLGRNWGMPMTQKAEPELVTAGPYRRVRHPIYSGIILAMVGTAIAVSLYWLIAAVLVGAYFIYSATVEERFMASQFPGTYPEYKRSTKMLIPFIL